MALDAGRRRCLAAAGAILLGACHGGSVGAGAGAGPAAPLVPLRGLLGARLLLKTDALGSPLPGAYGAFQPFVFPVAVAAGPIDIFIADAGNGRLYRYDRSMDAMAVMPVRAMRGTRLHAGSDGSLYVLDPGAAAIQRYARNGQPLPSLLPSLPTASYREFAVDPATGRGYAVDAANLRIDRIEPQGRLALAELESTALAPVAYEHGSLYVADVHCRCVIELRDGRERQRLAAGELRQPLAIAVSRGRIYAIDGFDRSLCVVHPGGVERMAPSTLGLVAPEALAVADGLVYVADGAGHSVAILREERRKP